MSQSGFLQFATIRRFLSKLPGFSNPEKYSLSFLNASQFLGVLNDNVYKFILIFYLIGIQGNEYANSILAWAGAIFVIPFLLFSSIAGTLADRFSKSRLILLIKAFEILIILLAILGFILKMTWGCYGVLFLLATQSAFFGPPKYGIICELVEKNQVSKANGLITSFTYLAIIFGTFLAPFLTEMTDRNFVLIGFVCLFFAIVGFLSSFGIKYTYPVGTKKKVYPFFIKQIIHTLVECKDQKHLLVSVAGSSFFLFLGGFTQLNIIPFAMQALNGSAVSGGYLFLSTALGIAFGAFIAGRASKERIELGLACIGGICISVLFFLLSVSHHTVLTVGFLFLIGFFGGLFVVPFDSFIQLASPEKIRGHVIAASNFMSFVGVLLASLALYFLNGVLGLLASSSFALMGFLTLGFSIYLMIRLSDLFLSYTSKRILHRFFKIKLENFEVVKSATNPILMLENGSFIKAWLLCGILPAVHLLIPQYKTRSFPWFQKLFYSIHRIDSSQKFEELIFHSKAFMQEDSIPCVYLNKKKPVPDKQMFSLRSVFLKKSHEIISINFEKTPKGYQIFFSPE